MHAIPELRGDLQFLNKFECQKMWGKCAKKNEKLHTNFLLHPKRLSSDSEESWEISPRKFSSETPNLELLEEVEENICAKETEVIIEPSKDLIKPLKGKAQRLRPSSYTFGAFDKKFKPLVEKILKLLTSIRQMIEQGVPLPDGVEDFLRRNKRLQEFTTRFARTYLYPLSCNMEEINSQKTGPQVDQKILGILQVILQGLQAYHKHLPTSVGKCASDKLKLMLDQISDICTVYNSLKPEKSENSEFISALRNHSQVLADVLTTFDLKFIESEKLRDKVKDTRPAVAGKNKSKLSMYKTSVAVKREMQYRKGLETLRNKYNVKSKYKTATFKHRPPVEKQQPDSTKVSCFKFNSVKNAFPPNSPKKFAVREDDIETMVQMESEPGAPPNSLKNVIHENSRHELVHQDHQDNKVEEALEVLRNFLSQTSDSKDDFLKKIASEVEKRKEEEAGVAKKQKESVVSITGAKNAKLICIKDYSSDEELSRKDKEIMTDTEKKLAGSQTDIQKKTRISDDILDYMLQSVTQELEVNEILENLYNAEFQY